MTRIEDILGVPVRPARWNAVCTITPEQAKRILEDQPTQRPVNQKAVEAYAADMRAGAWQITHEGIAADEHGQLLNGQHRLWACFLGGVPFATLVFFNEPRDTFDVIDRGTPRTVAQLAVIKGQFQAGVESNSGVAALRFLWAFDLGRDPTAANNLPGFSSRVADAVLMAHPGAPEMLRALHRAQLGKFSISPGSATALFTMFDEANPTVAAQFLHEIRTGEGLPEGHPALTLRNSGLPGARGQRPNRRDMTYRLVRAWNARVKGRQISVLYGAISPNGERNRLGGVDVFPEIAGYVRKPMAEGR